jgi:hypothetical protein
MTKKKYVYLSLFLATTAITTLALSAKYNHDKKLYQPKLWIGLLDYRINFRDMGASLNQCLGKNEFRTGLVYRSNKYFSGWSCDKIGNPNKIYSLNYSTNEPHQYYCIKKDGSYLTGQHSNTTFEISDIENLSNWNRPEFKQTMCHFFNDTLNDIIQEKTFLFHCDVGRDRTGAFAAMLSIMLAEQKGLVNENLINAVECDYEKTSSLEKDKFGKMKKFISDFESKGGVSQFIATQCMISQSKISQAADHFIPSKR